MQISSEVSNIARRAGNKALELTCYAALGIGALSTISFTNRIFGPAAVIDAKRTLSLPADFNRNNPAYNPPDSLMSYRRQAGTNSCQWHRWQPIGGDYISPAEPCNARALELYGPQS